VFQSLIVTVILSIMFYMLCIIGMQAVEMWREIWDLAASTLQKCVVRWLAMHKRMQFRRGMLSLLLLSQCDTCIHINK
jgi:hypothetical protein